MGGLWLLETCLACVTYGTLYTQAGFTVVESKAHFLNQRLEQKGPA